MFSIGSNYDRRGSAERPAPIACRPEEKGDDADLRRSHLDAAQRGQQRHREGIQQGGKNTFPPSRNLQGIFNSTLCYFVKM